MKAIKIAGEDIKVNYEGCDVHYNGECYTIIKQTDVTEFIIYPDEFEDRYFYLLIKGHDLHPNSAHPTKQSKRNLNTQAINLWNETLTKMNNLNKLMNKI